MTKAQELLRDLIEDDKKFICPRCKQPGTEGKMTNSKGQKICVKCQDYINRGSSEQ